MERKSYKKSKYLCPHCGSVLYHEKPDTTLDNYPLVCPECDENFFEHECEELSEDTRIVEATIGYRMIDVSGEIEYHGGQTDMGICYKSLTAWKTGRGVVYVSEYGLRDSPQKVWTKSDLISFVRDELEVRNIQLDNINDVVVELAEELLMEVDWQDLSTLWSEWMSNEDYSFVWEVANSIKLDRE